MIDYHIHLERGPYTFEWLHKFWQQAQARGISEIGITEHMNRFSEFRGLYEHLYTGTGTFDYMKEWLETEFPYSINEYLDFLAEARQRGIPLKIGLEADYFPEKEGLARELLNSYELDYVIGSVHVLGKWGFDFSAENGWAGKDVADVYREYFATLSQAALSGLYDVIGHLDVVKVFGHRPNPTIQVEEELTSLLEIIAKKNLCIEVSTAGLRKPVGEMYPAENILEMTFSRQIPITFSSDAHIPEDVGYQWEKAVIAARRCGYKEYRVFSKRQPYAEKLPK